MHYKLNLDLKTDLTPKKIFNALETHDSLRFLTWKDASNEPIYETFRLIVVEILDSKDNIADEHGSIVKQNYISPRFLKLQACIIHHNFLLIIYIGWPPKHYQFNHFYPFQIGSSWLNESETEDDAIDQTFTL